MSQQPERVVRPVLGRHPVDPVSLIAGVIAVGIALGVLFDLPVRGAVLVPLLLVLAGALGVIAALRPRR